MDVTSTIKALRERCPSFENRIFGVASWGAFSLDAVNPESLPAAYVVPIDENPSEAQRTANSYYQEITAAVGVVIVMNNEADERGQDASATAESLKKEIYKAILSWSPTDDPQAIYENPRQQTIHCDRAVLIWQLTFECTYAIGLEDTRQPDQLAEDCGNFDSMHVDVDMISSSGAPDGKIDATVHLTDLYGSDESESES